MSGYSLFLLCWASFLAGWAFCPQNGRATVLVELHRNGSGDEVGTLNVDFDDLPDLKHVLDRAIAAHAEEA